MPLEGPRFRQFTRLNGISRELHAVIDPARGFVFDQAQAEMADWG